MVYTAKIRQCRAQSLTPSLTHQNLKKKQGKQKEARESMGIRNPGLDNVVCSHFPLPLSLFVTLALVFAACPLK